MASLDDNFRNSRPSIASKRKIEDPTSSSAYRSQSRKAPKLTNGDSPHTARANVPSSATVEDEPPADDEDIEAGPAPPPDEDLEERSGEEDEEGRFFGGGVTKQERQALDYIEQNDNDAGGEQPEEVYDVAWLRRTTVSLQKKIDKNADMRARYADQPQKFIQSEADLDDELKGLSILSEHTELYSDFAKVKEGGIESVVNLLGHENTDIVMRAVQVLGELTDEDTGAEEAQWRTLVKASLKAGLTELLVSNLDRLDEIKEEDRDGVYQTLGLMENLCSDSTNLDAVALQHGLQPWLLRRIEQPDPAAPAKVGQNRQYTAEILAILLQGSPRFRDSFAKSPASIDAILQLLSAYRKRDPERDSDEEEFVENLFGCITVLVDDAVGASSFLDNEGVELCLIMLREGGKFSKSRALKVLDHVLAGQNAAAACERVVEAAGLKTIFGSFMKLNNPNEKDQPLNASTADKETTEHLLGVISSLLRYTPADSPARIRTLAKFVERDYEKIGALVHVRAEAMRRLARMERQIEEEKAVVDVDEEMEVEWLSRRMEAGLFAARTVDVVLAWLVAEDQGAAGKIKGALELDQGLPGLAERLKEQIGELGGTEDAVDGTSATKEVREMLESLLRCVEAAV